MSLTRRDFVGQSAAGIGIAATGLASLVEATGFNATQVEAGAAATSAADTAKTFEISLAEWSVNKSLFAKKMDHLDFPKFAKETCGIDAVEYVNQFFMDKAKDAKYLAELNKRCSDLGVRQVLIMCDDEGYLGDPDNAKRTKAVENHYKWADAAKTLGCHSIRVNAYSLGTPEEQHKLAVDGLSRLLAYAVKLDLNVIVENHGKLSSNGKWLTGVMKEINSPRIGTLPDFGNFYEYDRYLGVEEMMPFAKGVSAKSYDFDAAGNETKLDYPRLMKIVLAAGYHGRVGIEYEGERMSELDGVMATKKLLLKIRDGLPK